MRIRNLIGCTLLFSIASVATKSQAPSNPSSQQQQKPGMNSGIASGVQSTPQYDQEKRPITAGGFVDPGKAPIVFQDITKQAGLSGWIHKMGVPEKKFIVETNGSGLCLIDYNNDGWLDIYLVNGATFDSLDGKEPPPHAALFRNNHDGTFTDVSKEAGVQNDRWGYGCSVADYDNDGWPDLFVTSYLSAIDESLKTYVGGPHNAETLKLYRNKHDGTFEDVTAQVGLDKVFMPMGANFGDIDNDGYLDIYLGVGQPSFTALLPHVLLRNDGGKSFVDVTESSGTGELHKGHGIAFGDLSRRGSEDIVAEIGGAVPADKHALRVFENPGNSNDWLNVHLVGVKSNREALGALIHVTVKNGDAPPRSIYRTVGQTSSFGANPLEQHIGLGPNAQEVSLDVTWPSSGTRQHFRSVAKNQYIEIKELAPSYTQLERHPFRLGKGNLSVTASTARKPN